MASAASIISAISNAIKIGTQLIQAGQDAAPVAKLIYDTFVTGKAVTQADLDAFSAETDRLSAELQQPIPPEPGAAG